MSNLTMQNVSVMSVQYWHYSFDFFLDSMERCRVKNIDLWGGAPHYCRLDHPTSAAANRKISGMRRQIEDRGMRVVIYTPETLNYPFSLSSPENELRSRTVDFLDMASDDALAFGTDRLFINSGCGLLDLPREESWSRAVETIGRICEFAEKKGVTVIMEQLQPYESNLVVTCSDVARMLGEVGSANLQACVDLVAMEVAGDTLQEYYDAIPDRIRHIHYADGGPSGHYILGDGNLPLTDYISTLEAHGYSEFVTLEIDDSIYWSDPH